MAMFKRLHLLRYSRSAFTLIELLTVIAIIGILAAILIPTVGKVRLSAQRASALSNVRQIAMAISVYASDQKGSLPRQVENGLDWSGVLVTSGVLASDGVFASRADNTERRVLVPPSAINGLQIRSFGINSAKYTYTGGGYKSPWPKDITSTPARLESIPAHVMLVGENWGGEEENSGAYVGVPEHEGIDGYARNLYSGTGANYAFADGHAEFLSATEMNKFRADTAYVDGDGDPWKWR